MSSAGKLRSPLKYVQPLGDPAVQEAYEDEGEFSVEYEELGSPRDYPMASMDSSNDSFLNRTFGKMNKGSVRGSILTLAASAVGAGCLSLPLVLKNLGFTFGLIILVLGAAVSLFSMWMLVYCGNSTGIKSFSELATFAYGSWLAAFLQCIIILYCFGTSVAYLVVISKSLPDVFKGMGVDEDIILNEKFDVGIVTAAVVFPLCLLRDVSSLRYSSLFSVIAMIYVSIAVFARSFYYREQEASKTATIDWGFLFNSQFPKSCTIVLFAFTCHINIFSVYLELTNPLLRRMKKVTRRSVVLALVLYAFVGIFGYVTFGENTEGNILSNYDNDDVTMLIGRLAVSLTLSMNVPLQINPALGALEGMFFEDKPWSRVRHTIMATVLVGLALVVAIVVPNVDTVFSLLGAICSTNICYIVPGLLYFRLYKGDNQSLHRGMSMGVVVVVGCVGLASVVMQLIDIGNGEG